MATTPEPPAFRNNTTIDFPAPPPSPVASSQRSSLTNNQVLTEFLENSLKVPDLILPDRVFPRQKSIEDPPKLDLRWLASLQLEDHDSIFNFVQSVAQIGCFQVINHGVSHDLIKSVLATGAGIFRIPREKRKIVTRTTERTYGFEDGHGEDDQEMSEEFVWYCRNQSLMLNMEKIWPLGYSNLSEKLEKLSTEILMVAEKALQFLHKNSFKRSHDENATQDEETSRKHVDSMWYLKKHSRSSVDAEDHGENSLRHDVIRMLIRGSQNSHALCIHVFNECDEFHVYSKKGWTSFQTDKDALLVTIGDKLQTWSCGEYKHVIGRPVYKELVDDEECISMAFVYAPSNIKSMITGEEMISLGQQLIIFILFSLVYNLCSYIC